MAPIPANQLFSTRRLEALTDGVFAIAMTLLVLDLKVSDLGHVTTSAQLWGAIVDMNSSLISFVVSFLLLGSMWAVHMRQFEFIKHADRHLTMINTLRLLAVVVMPLTTSIAGTYDDLVLGRVLFPLNFLILAVLSWWEWNYALTLPGNDPDPQVIAGSRARNRLILVTATTVVIASVWIGELAFLLFILTPVLARYFRPKGATPPS